MRRSGSRSGLTLIELVVGLGVLMIGVLGYSRAMVGASKAALKTREMARAAEAARQMVERIEAEAFADRFRSFNADPADDPGGPGTAPGASFAVPGLNALPSDPDGKPGEIVFPTLGAAVGVLREDASLPALGMPRDLNGDGIIDGANHATDYKLLPLIVRVRWTSTDGTGQYELKTMLANY